MASAVPEYDHWFESSWPREVSSALGDPDDVAEIRRSHFQSFLDLPVEPNPLYRKYAYFAGVNLSQVKPTFHGTPVPAPPANRTTLRIVHDASGTRVQIPSALKDAGVTALGLEEIWQDPALRRELFDRTDPPSDRLTALGLACVNRAIRIDVPDRCRLPVRVQEISVLSAENEALSVRRLIRAGRLTRVLFGEEVYSVEGLTSQRFHASSSEVFVAEDARVGYLSVHAPDSKVVSIYSRHATVGAHAHLSWLWSGFGGFRTKAQMTTDIPGQGGSVDDLQTFFGDGEQAYDSSVRLTHIGTDTHGQSITRGVFRDQSRGTSRGLVRIEANARKTLSFLSEHAMLLSRGARSDTIPILEILCRDVKATHSSSVAPVDPEKVFYLESRGMTEHDAIRMIGEGFLSHVLEKAPVLGLRELLYPTLAKRWEGETVAWKDGAFPALPALEISGEEAAEEWRFDSKLR